MRRNKRKACSEAEKLVESGKLEWRVSPAESLSRVAYLGVFRHNNENFV